ncbi:hypothetical protein HN51_016314 [Arachis hypogaea]|nr:3-hydroxyisobutyryl-CoA hydrolase-like protein [Arachis hypogaea]
MKKGKKGAGDGEAHKYVAKYRQESERCFTEIAKSVKEALKSLNGKRRGSEVALEKAASKKLKISQPVLDECFSKNSIEEIIKSLESEANKKGNEWIATVLKGMKRTSPTALKIVLRSVHEGRNETLFECLKKEFRLTMNILQSTISEDMYEVLVMLKLVIEQALVLWTQLNMC